MTTKKAKDFLDKELFVNHSIVTFRSLSRELGIHVNDAKNELQRYYDAVRDGDTRAVPTYLVSGDVPALMVSPHTELQQSNSAMDVDMDLEFEEDKEEEDVDVVYQSKVLLVDARMLEEATSQFSRVHSVHIYSLSPSRLVDPGLVCTPSFKVHQADAQGGPKSFIVVGKITGSHVKLKTGVPYKNMASSSKTTLDVPPKAALKTTASIKTEQQTIQSKADTKEHVPAMTPLPKTESKDRPKPLGKLDWSKAKTKEKEPVAVKTREDKKPKPELKSTVSAKDLSESKKLRPESTKPPVLKSGPSTGASGDVQKRGIKRKPRIDSDLESESEPASTRAKPSTSGGLSLKKMVVCSDGDDDSETQVRMVRRPQRKSCVISDSEMSLQAMMDVDDEYVDRVSRVSNVHAQHEEEESSEPEVTTAPPVTSEGEESEDIPIVPKKPRRPRKVVPVGRNGVKKRRIVKSRTTTDAKGYMHTEDYSSYESVEGEEEEVELKPKGKGRETKKAEPRVEETKSKVIVKEENVGKPKAKATPKPRGGASKRGGLLNFFGPDKGKK